MKILVVEDDSTINELVAKGLSNSQFKYLCDSVFTIQQARAHMNLNSYDCIILDLNLPDGSGFELISYRNEIGSGTPILILSARDSIDDKIKGLEIGAEDYLTKPFSMKELRLRVFNLIKLTDKSVESTYKINSLEVNLRKHSVKIDGQQTHLNTKEYGILEYLLLHRGRPVSQEELLEHVWDREVDMLTQTVRANIKTLRQKIDPDKNIIKNKRGVGYYIE